MTNFGIKEHGSISLHNILLPVLAGFLPSAVHSLFSRLPSYNRTLKLEVKEWHGPEELIDLHMEWPKKPEITIVSTSPTAVYSITSTVLIDQFRDIDHFVFFITERSHYTIDIGIDTYNTIFKAIPALTKVTFDIPKSYKDIISSEETYQSPLLETLTLRPCFNVKVQSMLDAYALMFPNLKYLNLYYYDGVWKQESREVYINLNGYNLEQLVFDITPIRRTMKENAMEGEFFVVQVVTSRKKERFTISLDLSSVNRENDRHGQKYVCVHITVSTLKCLELCMYSENDYYEEYLHHLYNDQPKRITVFK